MNGKSLTTRLIGTWRLQSFVSRRGQNVRHPFGVDALGLLVYTATGHMSGQLMRLGRPPAGAGTLGAGSDDEVRAAATGYVAYAGTFEVDEADNIVMHHVMLSLLPNLVGTTQRRHVVWDGDILELQTPAEEIDGVVQRAHLRWERVPI
jgi:Lipocalin-like domain